MNRLFLFDQEVEYSTGANLVTRNKNTVKIYAGTRLISTLEISPDTTDLGFIQIKDDRAVNVDFVVQEEKTENDRLSDLELQNKNLLEQLIDIRYGLMELDEQMQGGAM